MNNPYPIIKKAKNRLSITETFKKAEKGTKSQVYLSDNFVIKINKKIEFLKNEYAILKSLDFDVVPKVIDFLVIQNHGVLIEKKLVGQSIDEIWRTLDTKDKNKIIQDLVNIILEFNKKKYNYFWSAQCTKKFNSYSELLFYKFDLNKEKIFKNKKAYSLYLKISHNLDNNKAKKIFSNITPTLVHGDLIIHNLLTDGRRLTGILDWECAQYGDYFYDLARIIYYQECAKAYMEEEKDEFFEYDFTMRFIEGLNKNIKFSEEKYRIIRSLYFIYSILWALDSRNPEKNLSELKPPIFLDTKI